jgi:metacaspase-1
MIRASCLGTNYIGTGNDLSECVNDAKDMTTLLKGQSFVVDTFLEKDVTSVRFRTELTKLVDMAVNGEITGAAFTHSGHGTQGYDPKEADFYDEGCYFTDGVVWDKEVAQILSRIPAGFPFFMFLDTCFSGGMMKAARKNKIRFVPPKIPIPLHAKPRMGFKEAITMNAIYIAACSEGEYSYDAVDLNNGAATFYLKTTFKKDNLFLDWFNKVTVNLPSDDYPQTPQLICKEELKSKKAFSWFIPIVSDVPDIPPSPNPNPVPNDTAKKKLAYSTLKKIDKLLKKYMELYG